MDRLQHTDRTDDIIRNCMASNVPESKIVNRKIEQAYKQIRSMQSMPAAAKTTTDKMSGKNTIRKASAKPRRTSGKKTLSAKYAAAAALFLSTALIFVKNPALAAQIPFIGHIFKSLEQKVSYPGDYSENSVTLPALPAETTGGQEVQQTEQGTASTPWQAVAGGMTVTLSEVSYDSNAIYLALLIENENEFANNAQSSDMMYLECQADMYRADKTKETFCNESGNGLAYMTEGTFTDSHTFKGLVQLTGSGFSLSDYTGCDITFLNFVQELTSGTKVTGTLAGETETISYIEYDRKTYEGPWVFHLDFSDLQTTKQEVPVNQTNDQGFGIEKLVKTKYELYAVPIFPAGAQPGDYVVTIWDSDGNPLESHGDNLEIRSIYGRDVSSVTVYLLKWDDFVECKGNNSYRQPERAIFQATVDLAR